MLTQLTEVSNTLCLSIVMLKPAYSDMIMLIYSSVNWVSVDSDNGLALNRQQASTWTNTDLLSIGPLEINFSKISIEMQKIQIHENAFEHVCEMVAILSS